MGLKKQPRIYAEKRRSRRKPIESKTG